LLARDFAAAFVRRAAGFRPNDIAQLVFGLDQPPPLPLRQVPAGAIGVEGQHLKVSVDNAERNASAFRRLLARADCFSERAIRIGSFHENTPLSKSSALLRRVTSCDHCLAMERTLEQWGRSTN
jgi:hypothetical protein